MSQARMRSAAEVHVLPRNLRWELSFLGVTRPMLDWFCSKDRAIEFAFGRAQDVGARAIVVERQDHSVEQVIDVEVNHVRAEAAARADGSRDGASERR